MTNTYEIGNLIKVTGTFTDSDGTVQDPTALTVYYKDPSDNITELVYLTDSDVIQASTGVYTVNISVDEEGKWYYRFKGTGSAQAAGESFFRVSKLNIST